jgi:hypothetical protein
MKVTYCMHMLEQCAVQPNLAHRLLPPTLPPAPWRSMVLIHVLAAYQVYSQPVFYLVRVACSNSPAQYQPALPLRRQRLRFGLVTFLSRHLAELTACLPLQPAG